MKLFEVSEASKTITTPYPSPAILLQAAKEMPRVEKESFLRLWLSEGIPFAFRSNPMLYEKIRDWMGSRLRVHPKVVTLIGSARIGYSLAAYPKYGRPFGDGSDLDFSVVQNELFRDLANDFSRWESDMAKGLVKPRGKAEERYWPENLNLLPYNINSGFVDAYKIPTLNRYPVVQRVVDTQGLLKGYLKAIPNLPVDHPASIRVYRDWGAFVAQLYLNFSFAVASVVKRESTPSD